MENILVYISFYHVDISHNQRHVQVFFSIYYMLSPCVGDLTLPVHKGSWETLFIMHWVGIKPLTLWMETKCFNCTASPT